VAAVATTTTLAADIQ